MLIIWCCIFAVVCYLVEVVGPIVLKKVLEPYGILGKVEVSAYQVNNAALWDGKVWYVRSQGRLPDKVQTTLVSLPADGKGKSCDAATVVPAEPWLVAGKDRLWILSESGLSCYRDGVVQPVQTEKTVKPSCRPFRYGDTIAVLQHASPGKYDLMALEDGQWRQKGQFALGVEADSRPSDEDLQVVQARGSLHFFCRPAGQGILYRSEGDSQWTTVGSFVGQWKAACIGGRETLFYHDSSRSGGPFVIGLRRNGSTWEEYLQHKIGWDIGMGICPVGEDGDFILLRRVLPLGAAVHGFAKDKAVWEFSDDGNVALREDHPILSRCHYFFGPLGGFLMAVLLTLSMGRFRTMDHSGGAMTVRYASPARRALAAGIDTLLIVVPFAAYAFAKVEDFLAQPLSLGGVFHILLQVGCAGLLWFPLVLLVICLLEGTTGVTPGKLVLGIRVLKPDLTKCGFGRALLRNLLRVIDSLGWYIVGMIAVASTTKCQRLGDLAAGTIVVRQPRRATAASSLSE